MESTVATHTIGVSTVETEAGAVDDGMAGGDDQRFRGGPLAAQFATLAKTLFDADTVAGVLDRVVEAARELTPGADLASVTIRDSAGRFTTPVYTDVLAVELDRLQYETDEGPCVDATRTPGYGLTACQELGEGEQWTRFGPAAASYGVHSVLAVGLFPDQDGAEPRMGALNLYAKSRHGLDSADRDIALLLASHAAIALGATRAVNAAELESSQLRTALDSRDVIGQAKGILMQRRGLSADEAFELLRRSSQDLNVKLVDLAAALARRHSEL
jgi:GAF domain-containing protein